MATQSPNRPPYVSVSNLTKKFGDLIAVDNLSFDVYENEIFGFLGPNGAGKSTTLNIITTLLDYDRGDVKVAGYGLDKNAKAIKSLLGVVPQDIALYKRLTAAENVRFFASLYGLRGSALRKAADEAIAFVGLEEWAKKPVGKMSGGMQRRINIACGIAHGPKLIVMDEPTVGVDTQSREQILKSIKILRDRGATIIYTSHYMPEVQAICDRIAIIDKGRLAAIGTESELLEHVTGHSTLNVDLADSNEEAPRKLMDAISSAPGVKGAAFKATERRIRIDTDLVLANLSPILKILADSNIPIAKVSSEAPDLETTFLALTGNRLNKEDEDAADN